MAVAEVDEHEAKWRKQYYGIVPKGCKAGIRWVVCCERGVVGYVSDTERRGDRTVIGFRYRKAADFFAKICNKRTLFKHWVERRNLA